MARIQAQKSCCGRLYGIEASAIGTPSEDDLRGLFSDFSVDSAALGSTVIKRNQLLAKVLQTVAQMDLGSKYNDTNNDTFGDTYEFLMQMYASEAGKSGGEFFTPQQVSELLARLASYNNPDIQKVPIDKGIIILNIINRIKFI